MRKYVIRLTLLLLLGVGIVLTVLALLPPRPGVMKANFDRIETGMTMTRVEGILGAEATYCNGASCVWCGEDGEAHLWFGDQSQVTGKILWQNRWTIGAEFRRWIRWPWW